jgi:hypothetical protein
MGADAPCPRARARGSDAVSAHAATGRALLVADEPPARHLSQSLMASCPQVGAASGSPLLVIARAVHAGAMARAFAEQGGGGLGMRTDNAPQGLESFAATEVSPLEEGTRLDRGPWPVARAAAPRHWVVVEPAAGKLWVS